MSYLVDMTRVNTPILTESQRQELDHLYKTSPKHVVRKNCHTILLKAEGRTSKDVGAIVGMTDVSVNSWVRRYNAEGVTGLMIKPGRGRKPIMEKSDAESVREHINDHRQRAETARAEWQAASGKKASRTTFRNFLKALADDINA
ncbi:MAG: helix-turn-helix domain-containing protein [Candidatus Kapaibacteriota bacterium]